MLLNEEHRRIIPIENLYNQEGYGAMKLMKEFPAKTWKKIMLNFLNRLKETGNCAQEMTLWSGHSTEQCQTTGELIFTDETVLTMSTSRMVAFIIHTSQVTWLCPWTAFSLVADVNKDWFTMIHNSQCHYGWHVREFAIVMTSAGNLLWT